MMTVLTKIQVEKADQFIGHGALFLLWNLQVMRIFFTPAAAITWW
jgi:hypothetical protein